MRLTPAAIPMVVLIVALCIQFAPRPACGGEVVTGDLRQQARQSLQNERAQPIKPSPNTVAVLYFRNRTDRPDLDLLQKGLAVMLITDLAKVKAIRVVERVQLQALIEELQLGASGLVTPDTAPRVGRLLGARYMVGGHLEARPAQQIAIAGSVLEMPEVALLGSPSSQGELDDVIRMEKEVAFEIIRLLQIELTPEEIEELRKPFTIDMRALMLFSRGLESSDQGAYEDAAAYYRDSLRRDPGLEAARTALDELSRLRLIAPREVNEALLRSLRRRVSFNEGPVQGPLTRREFSDPVTVPGPAGEPIGTADIEFRW